MRTNTEVRPTSVEEGERMVLPLSPDERDTADGIVDIYVRRLADNCGDKDLIALIPLLLDTSIRGIVCGEDVRYIKWDGDSLGFTDLLCLAIEDDACYDCDVRDGVTFDTYYYLEGGLASMVTALLGHRAYRAAHNALNVLVACDCLFQRKRAAMEEALKHPRKENTFPF